VECGLKESALFFCSVFVEQELGVPFISVSAPSIVSGMSGESEKTLRETFEEAKVRTSLPLWIIKTHDFVV
jgi:SpoVK/Ycf46/Vps4 family AAA+-type ATPase